MTIQNTTIRKAGPSQGNGVTTVFPFTFKVFTTADILVTYLDASSVESVLVLTTNYTVSLNADQNTSPGGSVTLLVAPATGTYITLTSQVANTQTLALTNSGGFYPESINNALDRTVIEIQQLAEQASRSITIPKSSTASPLLPIPTPLNVLAWNLDGTAITNVSLESSSNLSSYKATGTGAVTRTVASKLNDVVSIFDFFTSTQITSVEAYDSVEDVTVPIQTALDLGIPLSFPCGLYKITSGLQLKNGSKILGSGTWSGNDTEAFSLPLPLPLETVGTTVIKYAGVAGANVAIINASAEAVGTEPSQTNPSLSNYRNLSNVACTNLILDGNSLAGIGLYIARGLTNNNFDFVTVTKTTEHGFLVLISWQGNVRNWFAVLNQKCGITLGKNVFGWASNNVTVDECIFSGLSAMYSGTNASRVKLNQFNETTGYDLEYGIGFYQGRANLFLSTNTAKNGGAGLYLNVDRWPNKFLSIYSELNCLSTNATTDKYGIWFQGYTGHVSRHVHFENIYFGSGAATTDGIRLAGESPSRQGEDAVTFINVPILYHLKADWNNYILAQVSSDVSITGVGPYSSPPAQFPANIGIGGVAAAIMNIAIPTEITGGTTAYGILHNGAVQQDVTATAYYFRATNTVAASTTLTTLNSFTATQGTFDTGVTVGTQTGFFANSALASATNNYGFRGSLVASGTSRYNLYMDGTAPNYFKGNTYTEAGTTTMTSGFFYIPSAGGTPTGVPTTITGHAPMYYDTTNNKFYIYNGGWKSVVLA